jgi:zinc protease
LLLTFIGFGPLRAQAPGRIAVEHFTLPNGLEVHLVPDHSSPVVAVNIWYRAGAREEPAGKAGLARLFERLMFAGSAHAPPGAQAAMVEEVGGQGYAEVDEESARFGETMPSNRLNLGLWLEAERMRSLRINDTTVAQARFDLLDDLGRRVTNDPYTAAVLDGIASLYDSAGCPGYSHPSIGRAGSIAGLTASDAQTFFRQHYAPNQAALAVVGDFEPAAARQLVTQFFSDIPRGQEMQSEPCKPDFNSGARRRQVSDRSIARPAVGLFYRVPAHDHADAPPLELLGLILGQGNSARLPRALGDVARAAVSTQGGVLGDRRGPEVFGILGIAAPGVTVDSLSALLATQAAWAAGDSLTEMDLARAKTIYLATAVSARERTTDIADQVLHAALLHGSADAVNTEVGRVLAVSVADIRRVARTWLTPANSLELVITPEAGS